MREVLVLLREVLVLPRQRLVLVRELLEFLEDSSGSSPPSCQADPRSHRDRAGRPEGAEPPRCQVPGPMIRERCSPAARDRRGWRSRGVFERSDRTPWAPSSSDPRPVLDTSGRRSLPEPCSPIPPWIGRTTVVLDAIPRGYGSVERSGAVPTGVVPDVDHLGSGDSRRLFFPAQSPRSPRQVAGPDPSDRGDGRSPTPRSSTVRPTDLEE